jgi:hypothetical protein
VLGGGCGELGGDLLDAGEIHVQALLPRLRGGRGGDRRAPPGVGSWSTAVQLGLDGGSSEM